MDANSTANTPCTTLNSSLVPTEFNIPRKKDGKVKILEPHGSRRRPKSGDYKLLAAYVAAYTGSLIPVQDYLRFISPRGEQEWKRIIRVACDGEWREGETRRFDDIGLREYEAMANKVAMAWPFVKYFDNWWIIKWAMRITWTNRIKSARRRDKSAFETCFPSPVLTASRDTAPTTG
jgi:hypothetical protein